MVDKHTASDLIEQAFQDIDATKGVLDDTPFVYVTYTCVNMAGATIYTRLAEQEQDVVLSESFRERPGLSEEKSARHKRRPRTIFVRPSGADRTGATVNSYGTR